MLWINILLVGIGGAVGALCRYGVSLWVVRRFGTGFSWGTLAVNLSGCFLIGVGFALGVQRNILNPQMRLLFMTGFLGALTTFSTYAIETLQFSRNGDTALVLWNILANNVGGFLLAIAGLWLGGRI